MREWVYGRNPVYEVLRAQRRQPFCLLVAQTTQQKGRLAEILRLCSQRKVAVESVPRSKLDALTPNHQGVALEVSGYPYSDLVDILERAGQRAEPPFLLILDALQDPQNLGTLLRTAELVGVHGVLLPFRQTATITPAVVNASSGACEHLFVTQANLAQAIERLKSDGVWVYGLEDSPTAKEPNRLRLDGAVALVVGNEAQGLRPLVRRSCDALLRLPTRGRIDSYNAAVAGSIALFLVWQASGFRE